MDRKKIVTIRRKSIHDTYSNLKNDIPNIIFLMFLYFLQAVPLGLTGSLPYILSSRKVNYADQGTFSFAFWPFSLKLLWAPLVDSIFIKKLGRRKTWLIPVQYLIGIYMIIWSGYVSDILEDEKSEITGNHNIFKLTVIFFIFTFLAATQDIIVDGWALVILSSENISWSSTCESVGGTFGWFVGNVLFLVFESADFSNKYIRSILGLEIKPHGLVSIDKFMIFFGIIYLITTTLILFFKNENHDHDNDEFNIYESYKVVWKIAKLKPIRKFAFILFTIRLAFATESMSFLKLIELGVPKEKLGLLAVPLTPLQIVLPFLVSKLLRSGSPFRHYSMAFFFRCGVIAFFGIWVYLTPVFKESDGSYPYKYYIFTILIEAIHSISIYSSYMPIMFFFTQISDKTVGATYLTFLNTVANLARSITNTSALYIANFLTFKYCTFNDNSHLSNNTYYSINNTSNFNETILSSLNNTFCSKDTQQKTCKDNGGTCLVHFDPYYLETLVFFLFGLFWLIYFRRKLYDLESLPKSDWTVYQDKIKLKKTK